MDPSGRPAPERVETVLLDAGGVLLDLDYAYLGRLLASLGCPTTEEMLSRGEAEARRAVERRIREGGKVGEGWQDYFSTILGRAGLPIEFQDGVIRMLWEAHRRIGLWSVPVRGAVDAVKALRERGFLLGVVSNAEGHVERDLGAAGFDGLFEVVVDSRLVGVEKPDPAIFRIALERLGASAGTSVYVGDIPAVDVEGARAAGISPVLVDRHDLYPAIEVPRLRSIEELPGWLAASSGPAGVGE